MDAQAREREAAQRTQTHTPGPWEVVELADCQAIHGKNDNRICTVWSCVEYYGVPCGSIESQNKTQAEIDANAALIAASPALLDACQMALEVIRRNDLTQYCGEDSLTCPDGVKGIGDVLEAAIRTATESGDGA